MLTLANATVVSRAADTSVIVVEPAIEAVGESSPQVTLQVAGSSEKSLRDII